jgi:N-acetylglucosamine-6-phosphate deacetylase
VNSQLFAVTNGTVVTPDRVIESGAVVCAGDRIVRVGTLPRRLPAGTRVVDAGGGWICPGFVDIHVHGGGGADFMDGTVEAALRVCRTHAAHGTTTLLPTTTTGAPEQLSRMIEACAAARREDPAVAGARIGGIHLYGPYFAEDKAGCHSREGRRAPDAAEFQGYFRSGMIQVATCAAELPGAAAFYRAARRRGCLVTCGHSNASWQEMAAAFRAGMRHVDHFWCAMSSVPSVRQRLGVPMRGSMAEFVLANPEMSTEVIADGVHLAPELLNFAWKMLGSGRLCLVTDANRALDMPPGRYRFGPDTDGTWFESDGRAGWALDGGLASSARGMDHMVRIMARDSGAPLHEVIRMASLTPAERAGLADEIGSLSAGKRADLVLLDRRLKVQRVFVGGIETPSARVSRPRRSKAMTTG